MWQVRFSRPSPSALALVGGDGFVGLRSEGYEIEHWIRFRLIEIEGYGKPVSSNCILEDIGAYDFPANNCGLANVVPGVRLGPRAAEPCPRHELAATGPPYKSQRSPFSYLSRGSLRYLPAASVLIWQQSAAMMNGGPPDGTVSILPVTHTRLSWYAAMTSAGPPGSAPNAIK